MDDGIEDDDEQRYVANIHFDRRVYRGSNYASVSQMSMKGGNASQSQYGSGAGRRRKPKAPEKSPFAIPLPKQDRVPVDLTDFLVEKTITQYENSAGTQTDAFAEKKKHKPFVPKRTGVDATTRIFCGTFSGGFGAFYSWENWFFSHCIFLCREYSEKWKLCEFHGYKFWRFINLGIRLFAAVSTPMLGSEKKPVPAKM